MVLKNIKHWGFFTLILLLLFTLTACEFGDGPAIAEHEVDVIVTEVDSNLRIEDALVSLNNSRLYERRTNQDGVVTFSNVREGNYELDVTKPGWRALEDDVGSVTIDMNKNLSVEMVKEIFVGFDPYEGETNNFGDEDFQFLDLVFDVELREDLIEYYSVTIMNNNQEYTLRHKDGILEFGFVEDYYWIEIDVVTGGGDISAAVDGLSDGFIYNITEFKVTEVFILDENNELIIIPEEGIEIVEWSPDIADVESLNNSSERFNLQR